MTCSLRTLTQALFACLCIFSLTSELRAQGSTNTSGPPGQNWPDNPPVGVGTVGSGAPQNALQIHHNSAISATMPAILRLSDGVTDSINIFGALALMPDTSPAFYDTWSYLATQRDLVLHENIGDLILADFDPQPAAIRMSTTPDPTTLPVPGPFVPPAYSDIERVTIMSNGNIGIDLPPAFNGLDSAADQLQIGGGSVPPPGYTVPIPGLTISGGNRFEGMIRQNGGLFPADWRYIAFNQRVDHSDTSSNRFSRIAPLSASNIQLTDNAGGLVQLNSYPYDTSRGMHDFTHGISLELAGNEGLEMFSYQSSTDPWHKLFDIFRPGFHPSWATFRNVDGVCFIHTPTYIGDDSANTYPDFTNLTNVHPDIGDGKTWTLAVNGPILGKEFYVNLSDWPDHVLMPGYPLMTIQNFGNFMMANHHLPDLPSAKTMESGVPLGRTEAAMTKQMEEMALYIVQLNKKVEALETEVHDLKNQKERNTR